MLALVFNVTNTVGYTYAVRPSPSLTLRRPSPAHAKLDWYRTGTRSGDGLRAWRQAGCSDRWAAWAAASLADSHRVRSASSSGEGLCKYSAVHTQRSGVGSGIASQRSLLAHGVRLSPPRDVDWHPRQWPAGGRGLWIGRSYVDCPSLGAAERERSAGRTMADVDLRDFAQQSRNHSSPLMLSSWTQQMSKFVL